MTGTKKQIKWAQDIIKKVYENVDEIIRQREYIELPEEIAVRDGWTEERLEWRRAYMKEKLEIAKEIRNAYDRFFALPKCQDAGTIIDLYLDKKIPTFDYILSRCQKYAEANNIPVIEACRLIYKK